MPYKRAAAADKSGLPVYQPVQQQIPQQQATYHQILQMQQPNIVPVSCKISFYYFTDSCWIWLMRFDTLIKVVSMVRLHQLVLQKEPSSLKANILFLFKKIIFLFFLFLFLFFLLFLLQCLLLFLILLRLPFLLLFHFIFLLLFLLPFLLLLSLLFSSPLSSYLHFGKIMSQTPT